MIQVLNPFQLPSKNFAGLHIDDICVATKSERAELNETWLSHRFEGLFLLFWALLLLFSVLNYFNQRLLEFAETEIDDYFVLNDYR